MENILETNDLDMVKIDGKELTVVDKFDFVELTQQAGSSSWISTGKKSRALLLANGIWLMKIPTKDSGKYVWLKLTCKEDASTLGNFYKGSDTPGPARKFAQGGQSKEVNYKLYDKSWSVVDIGAFKVECSNKSDILKDNDKIYFVTSKGSDEWLVYLDARPTESKGTGGVFIGQEFNPSLEIEGSL